MNTKQLTKTNLTAQFWIFISLIFFGGLSAQTKSLTSKPNIKFNTDNRNEANLAFNNGWDGILKYTNSSKTFYFNHHLKVKKNILNEGNITTEGDLEVDGDITTEGNLHTTLHAFIDGASYVQGGSHMYGEAFLYNSATVYDKLNVIGEIDALGSIETHGLTVNWGTSTTQLAQASINTDSKVDHAALTVAGGVYIGPKADLASEDNLNRFDASYLEDFKLWVEDGIITERYGVSSVEEHQWRDMVFNKDYALPSLDEVREYINTHGHLKDVLSAKEVEENGYDLVDMDATLLQKIEELMLYTLEQKQQIDDLKNQIQLLKEQKNIKTPNSKSKI